MITSTISNFHIWLEIQEAPLRKNCHRLLNWQIQSYQLSWAINNWIQLIKHKEMYERKVTSACKLYIHNNYLRWCKLYKIHWGSFWTRLIRLTIWPNMPPSLFMARLSIQMWTFLSTINDTLWAKKPLSLFVGSPNDFKFCWTLMLVGLGTWLVTHYWDVKSQT